MKRLSFLIFLVISPFLHADPGPFGGIMNGVADFYHPARWTIFQVQLAPLHFFRLFSEKADNYGVACNIWGNIFDHYGDNCGLSVNGYANGGCNYGLALGMHQFISENSGLAIGVSNGARLGNRGVQLGVVNYCYGNYSRDSQASGNESLQLGVVNISSQIRKVFVFNVDTQKTTTIPDQPINNKLQIGFYNQANWGWQIGLINYNRQSVFPWTVFFNYAPSDSSEK